MELEIKEAPFQNIDGEAILYSCPIRFYAYQKDLEIKSQIQKQSQLTELDVARCYPVISVKASMLPLVRSIVTIYVMFNQIKRYEQEHIPSKDCRLLKK